MELECFFDKNGMKLERFFDENGMKLLVTPEVLEIFSMIIDKFLEWNETRNKTRLFLTLVIMKKKVVMGTGLF